MSAALHLSPQTEAAYRRAMRAFAPPVRMSVAEWAERYRILASSSSSIAGPFRLSVTPYLRGILEAYKDPRVREIVCQKSAQVGWTDGVLINILGYHVHHDPAPIIVLFAKDGDGKKFMRTKFEPAIKASPVLLDRINLKSKSHDNTLDYKGFEGGYIQLAGSNSPGNVKSNPFRIAAVEEPDDASKDVRGQGEAIALVKERLKTFHGGRLLVGGTPTVAGFSHVCKEMEISDQRRYFVPCPDCGHLQFLRWEQVQWLSDATTAHPIYASHRPDTALYVCEECGSGWDDDARIDAISQAEEKGGGWAATADFDGVAGFYINELYSAFPGSRLPLLARKWLEAEYEARRGEFGLKIAFTNNTLGEPWQLKGQLPEVEALQERAKDYAEFTVPHGALLATAGVDVQHNRLAVIIRAWGRGEESWLVYWDEIQGNPLEFQLDSRGRKHGPVWDELDKLLARPIRNAGGGVLHVSAYGVDSGDGQTADAVYSYVRSHKKRGAVATKGSSVHGKEIFSAPSRSVDTTAAGKAAKYGLRPYIIGSDRAKDLLHARLRLEDDGPGRFHFYAGVRDDYYGQLISEVKIPRGRGGRPEYRLKAGERNEALDCEVIALHQARRLRLHTWGEAQWRRIEAAVRQGDLLQSAEGAPGRPGAPQKPKAEGRAGPPPSRGGFGSDEWAERGFS